MEEFLVTYLKLTVKYTNDIKLKYFNVDGAICYVEYYTDQIFLEKQNINIWDVIALVFKNSKKENQEKQLIEKKDER